MSQEKEISDLQPAAAPIDEDAEIPPIMYNGDTKRDPALRELLARQAQRHVLSNPRGDASAPSPADERAAFEAWWVRDVPERYRADTLRLLRQSRELDGKYGIGNAEGAWEGWQARAASANETGAEGADLERALSETIDERDRFEEDGTRLANAVGEFLGVDVGEWSSANDPILAAIEALESRSPAMAPVAWKTTHPAVCVPITEDREIAEQWRAHGYQVIEFFDRPVFAMAAEAVAIPAGWMLVPKHRGTKPLAELIIAASLACVENRLMEDDDRHEFAQFADQLQRSPQQSPATNERSWTRKEIDGLLDDADRLSMHPGRAAGTIFDCARVIRELIAAAQPAQASYDGNHVENHCPECSQYESECECVQADARDDSRDAKDARYFRWLCAHPDWRFIEALCQKFVAESQVEFYTKLSAEIERRMKHGANKGKKRLSDGSLAFQQAAAEPQADARAEQFPYQKTFNAIAAATSVEGGNVSISVKAFREAFGDAQADAGVNHA